MTVFAPILQAFFTDRLITQRQASDRTITAYRDTFRLLLGFAAEHHHKPPQTLRLDDLDAPFIAAFLDHLETVRHNSIRTRNARLTAIHSLFAYTALRHPEHAELISRVLAIPAKRYERNLLTWLTEPEVEALLAACDRGTWTGRRDHTMLLLTVQTGLRISELTALSSSDVHLGAGPHVHCLGKGRKHRDTPLLPATVEHLRIWLDERGGHPDDPLFATSTGRRLSRDAIEQRIRLYHNRASRTCSPITTKKVTTHTLRHTAAMQLLHSGVDISVIALWLGHESIETTQIYIHADMTMKEQAIAKTTPPNVKPGRYQPTDPILAWLQTL
jgi:integrase/recombinase XerD